MRNKALKLVYLNMGGDMSYSNLKVFCWVTVVALLIMAVMSSSAIKYQGISWKTLFPIVSASIWSLLYWIFVLAIRSDHVKKTFELRFLVNGISGLFVSSFPWIFGASASLMETDNPYFNFSIFLWILLIYILVSIIYVVSVISGVHNGVSRTKIYKKTKSFLTLLMATMTIIFLSRVLSELIDPRFKYIGILVCVVLVMFTPIIIHINFVQYYYCKKYCINCDEDGDTTSPHLDPYLDEETIKICRPKKKRKRKK